MRISIVNTSEKKIKTNLTERRSNNWCKKELNSVTIPAQDELFMRESKHKSNSEPWKSVYKLCWHKFDAKCICKINHWKLIENVGKQKPEMPTIYLRCWLVTLTAIWMWFSSHEMEKESNWSKLSLGNDRAKKRERTKCMECGIKWKQKDLSTKRNEETSLNRKSKSSTTLKGWARQAKYKLVVILHRSCEPNWFSWSANMSINANL